MAKMTLAQYLTYMKKQPRTKGWGALLVYDRFKTNQLLAQEHIERFDGSLWMKPISLRVETEGGSWTDLSELTLDKPTLSFVNSNIASSAARLSMHMLSGKIRLLRKKLGSDQTELIGISRLDPLNAPAVRMNITLNASNNGQVSSEGRVTLDLSKGSGYTFEVSSWKDMNEKVGTAIQSAFAALPEAERVWELNTLKPVAGELNPTSFAVRTHSLARAGNAIVSTNEAELEEGSVLVGVAFNGEGGGDFPSRDEDMPYLLPLPAASSEHAPYTMNLVLNNTHWSRNVLVKLLKSVPDFKDIEPSYVTAGDFTVGVNFSAAKYEFDGDRDDFDEGNWVDWQSYEGFEVKGGADAFKFRLSDNKISFEWTVAGRARFASRFFWNEVWWLAEDRLAEYSFNFKKEYTLALGDSGESKGRVVLNVGASTSNFDVKKVDDYNWGVGPFENYIKRDTPPKLLQKLQVAFDNFTAAIEKAGVTLDVLRLNGLLFRSEQAADPQHLAVTGDLSLLGTLAPKLTAFAVEPLEATLSDSSTQTFKLAPVPTGAVTWGVAALPGESGTPEELGTITNGVYTAPPSDKITGTSRRVIISATAGGNVSKALVTVIPKSVSVYPFMLSAAYSTGATSRYVLVGGSLGAALTWSMAEGSKGKVRPKTPADDDLDIPVDQNVHIYEAPVKSPGDRGTIASLLQLDEVQVTAGGRSESIDILIPWETTTATLKVTPQAGGTVKVALWIKNWGDDEEQEIAPASTLWGIVKGKGSMDAATGIYTPKDEGDYVILAGVAKLPGPIIWNYVVLPMPYEQAYTELLEYIQLNSTPGRA